MQRWLAGFPHSREYGGWGECSLDLPRRQFVGTAAGLIDVAAAGMAGDLDGLARRLVAESESHRGPVDWDQAAQLYLALSSFQVSQKEATGLTGERRQAVDRALSGALSRMRDVLRFPNGHDSAAQLRGPTADVDDPPVALEQFDRAIRVIRSALNDSDGAK